jgi:hypothetical protein
VVVDFDGDGDVDAIVDRVGDTRGEVITPVVRASCRT